MACESTPDRYKKTVITLSLSVAPDSDTRTLQPELLAYLFREFSELFRLGIKPFAMPKSADQMEVVFRG